MKYLSAIFLILSVVSCSNSNLDENELSQFTSGIRLSTDIHRAPASFRDVDEYREYHISLNNPDSHFHVILTNNSSKPINVYEHWNSWGWYNIEIELYNKYNKLIHTLKKKPRIWTMNGPTTEWIEPGNSFIISVTLNRDEWEIPFADGWHQYGIKVIYEVPKTKYSKKGNVWTGKLETPIYKATISYRYNKSLIK